MRRVLAVVNLFVFTGMIYINYLGGAGKINDISTGEVSALYPNLFTPAGYTFSIWGVIYLLNLAFIIHQLYKAFYLVENYDAKLNQGFFFITVTNAVWIVAWHRFALGYSLFLMLIMLVFLIATYWQALRPKYKSEYITEYVNFSVYLGWISVATIANAGIFLTTTGVEPFGLNSALLTAGVMALVIGITLFFVLVQANVWYALVILWAYVGIYIARRDELTSLQGKAPEGSVLVSWVALAGCLVILATLAYHRITFKKTN